MTDKSTKYADNSHMEKLLNLTMGKKIQLKQDTILAKIKKREYFFRDLLIKCI